MALHMFRCSLCVNFFVSLIFLFSVIECRPNDKFDSDAQPDSRNAKSLSNALMENNDYFSSADFKLVKNVFSDCLNQDFSLCLKLKAVNVLNRVLVKDDIDIMEGVTLRRHGDVNVTEFDPALIQSARSLDSAQKEQQVDQILQKQVTTLFSSRSIESEDSIPPEEGRGGKKKKNKYIGSKLGTTALTASVLLGPLFVKMIGLMAGKALLISKIAIVIAGTIALKKLASQPQQHEAETVSHHYGRSLDASSLLHPSHGFPYQGQQPQPLTQSYEVQTSGSTSLPDNNHTDIEEFRGRKKVYYDYEEDHTPTRIIIENGGRRPVMKESEDNWRPSHKKKHSEVDYDDEKYYKYAYKEKPYIKRKPVTYVDDYEPVKETYYSQVEYYEDEKPVKKRPGVLELEYDVDEVPTKRKPAHNKPKDDNKKTVNKKTEVDDSKKITKATPKPTINKNKPEENKKKTNEKGTITSAKGPEKNKNQSKTDEKNKIFLVTLTNKNNNSKLEERIDHKKGDLREEKIIPGKHPKIPFIHLQKPHHQLAQKDKDVLLKIGKLKISLFGGTIAMLFITLIDFILFTMYKSKDKDMQKIIDNLPPQYVSDMKPSQKPSNALVDMENIMQKYPGGQMVFNPQDSSVNQIPYAPISDSNYNNIQGQVNNDMLKYLNNIQAQTGGQLNFSDLKVPDDLLNLDSPGFDNSNINYPNNYNSNQPQNGVNSYINAQNLYSSAQEYPSVLNPNAQSYQLETSASNLDSGTLQSLMTTTQKNQSDKTQVQEELKIPKYQLPLANEVSKPNHQHTIPHYNNEDSWQNGQTYSQLSTVNNLQQSDVLEQAHNFAQGNINLQNIAGSINANQYYTSKSPPNSYDSTEAPIYQSNYKVTSLPVNAYSGANQVANNYLEYSPDGYRQDPYKQISNVLSNQFDYSSNNPVVKQFLQKPYHQQIAASTVSVSDSDFGSSNNFVQITSRPTKLQTQYKRIIKRRKIPTKRTVPRYRVASRSTTETSIPVSTMGRFRRSADFDTIDSFIRIRNTLVQQETPSVILNSDGAIGKIPIFSIDSSKSTEITSDENTSAEDEGDFTKETSDTEELSEYDEESNEAITRKVIASTTQGSKSQPDVNNKRKTNGEEVVKVDNIKDQENKKTPVSIDLNKSQRFSEMSGEDVNAVTEMVVAPVKFTLLSLSSGNPTKTVKVSPQPLSSNSAFTEKYNNPISTMKNEKLSANNPVSSEQYYGQVSTKSISTIVTDKYYSTETTKKYYDSIDGGKYYGSTYTSTYNVPTSTNNYEEILQPISVSTEKNNKPISAPNFYSAVSTQNLAPIVTEKYYSTETTRKHYSTVHPAKYFASMSTESHSSPISTSRYQESSQVPSETISKYVSSPNSLKISTTDNVLEKNIVDNLSEEDDEIEELYSGIISTVSPVVIQRKPMQKGVTTSVKVTKTTSLVHRNEDSKQKRPQSSTKQKKKNKNRVDSNTKSKVKKAKKSSKRPSSQSTAVENSGSKTKTTIKEDNEKFKQIEEIKEDGSKVIKIIIEPPSYKDPKQDDDDGEYDMYTEDKPEKPGSDDYFSFGIESPKDDEEKAKDQENKSEEEEEQENSDEEEEADDSDEDEKDAGGESEQDEDADDDDVGNALSLFYNAVMLDGISVIDTGILS